MKKWAPLPCLVALITLLAAAGSANDEPPGTVLSSIARLLYQGMKGVIFDQDNSVDHFQRVVPFKNKFWNRAWNSASKEAIANAWVPSIKKKSLPVLLSMFPGSQKAKQLLGGLEDAGEPFILTPLIESGKVDEARQGSLVDQSLFGAPSYSGFFTVNKNYSSNLFFWYFPAEVRGSLYLKQI